MLEIVTTGFRNAKLRLTGQTTLSEENIDEAVRDIRLSLLEADVEVGVVRSFLDRVKQRALGEVVQTSAVGKDKSKLARSPGEHFVLICHNELEKLMGPVEEAPIVFRRPLTTIMMVGLQGTGKTTTCAKLASYLKANKRRPMLVAADVYRPAAVDQLRILGERIGVPVFAVPGLAPPQLCRDAQREARNRKRDVLIFDTAGRLAIDEELMRELDEIKAQTQPHEVFLVCDAMAGQNTVQTASSFNRRLDITGFIMTKLDGDARGGAALSIKEVTGKPIKFLGMGEAIDKLDVFRPEGLASRILGMGDIVGLMKDFESVIDEKEAERDTRKLLRGQFTLDDFLKQIRALQKLGGVKELYEKFPIFGDGAMAGAQIDEKAFHVMESLIQSMTPAERRDPKIIDDNRARRIARGSGRKPEQVKDLVQRFGMMHQMMQGFAAQPGLLNQLPGFKQLAQIRGLKGQGIEDVIGNPADSIRAMTRGRVPMPPLGIPGATRVGNQIAIPRNMIPPGMNPEDYIAALQAQQGAQRPAGAPGPVSLQDRNKAKAKRKAAKKARKQSRRR